MRKGFLGIILAVTFMLVCFANEGGFFTKLEISGFKDSTYVVARIHDGENYRDWRFDTIYMVDDIAELHDVSKVKDPVRMYIFTDSGTITTYVQNGHKETISGDAEDISQEKLHYAGAPWSEDMVIYNKEIGRLISQLNKQTRKFMSLSTEEKQEVAKLSHTIDSLEKVYYKRYPNSWHALSRLDTEMMEMSKDDLREIYSSLEPEQRESCYGEALKKYLSIVTIELGDSLGKFNISGKDQYGNDVSLLDVTEPYILLDFSQCYCGPCILAAKEIHQIREKYSGIISFINYSCDDTEQDWQKMVKRDSIAWLSIFNGEGYTGETCLKYRVSGYPTFFLFGPDRKLIDRQEGYGPGFLESYLGESVK